MEEPAMTKAVSTNTTQDVAASKLMSKLSYCDEQLAYLLTQTADCLEALLERSKGADSAADTGADVSLVEFEDVAQDWLASVYDIQLTLRRAVRFLVRNSHPPVMTAAQSFIPGGGVNAVTAGTARGSATFDQKQSDSGSPAGSAEGDLSLSALRLKHQAWKDLVASLEEIQKRTQGSGQGANQVLQRDLFGA